MIGALGAAIVVVSVVALLSRLHASWFPDARETVRFLTDTRNRLAYPLGYWNGVASLTAIGLPLVLYLATSSRRVVIQGLATAALPAMLLTLYFTFSRGGTLAAVLGVGLFLVLAHDRVPKLATILIAGAGGAALIVAAGQRGALNDGLASPLAHSQGDALLTITLAVCAAAGLLQVGFVLLMRRGHRPAWSQPSRRASLSMVSAAVAIALLVAIGLGAPSKVSSAFSEFKESKGTPTGAARFGSFSSNGRWPYWSVALKENSSAPANGTGSGGYGSWWALHGSGGYVHDAHSLYFETLGELGIVGFVLIVGFLAWVLAMGGMAYRRAARSSRTQLAAALAGCAAFCLGAAYDWLWELAVIPIAFLLLASVLVDTGTRRRLAPVSIAARAVGVGVALAAMVAIAIPLSAANSILASQADVRHGDLSGALTKARDARLVEPFAAGSRLQEALVLEAQGRLAPAEAAAREATRLEADEWRAWLIRSRIEAERGRAAASVTSYRQARSLNPRSALFQQ